MDLALVSLKNLLESGIWGILGNSCSEIDLLFVSTNFPRQVVQGARCVDVVIPGLWGVMGPSVA